MINLNRQALLARCLLQSWKEIGFITKIKLTQGNEQWGHKDYVSYLSPWSPLSGAI